MACSSCSSGKDGAPGGCQNNGHCATGGCNKLNTYDWLSKIDTPVCDKFDVIEVSFKNGARKGFYHTPAHLQLFSSDTVVVEAPNGGYDIGRVSLTGELVRLQMRKKRTSEEAVALAVLRVANVRDNERLMEARDKENATMVKSRVIARSLDLDMKISDVEFQGDKRKATFYYTADGRVDFRELIRFYAKEFRVKIEMRQIGARQESARVGGLGSCGRELCCSTWLTDFKSVSTTAARYQNLAINQSKLSGQCGRLKCCLNYELDTYIDALKHFPKHADKLQTDAGTAFLLKTDIFQGVMYYAYRENMGKTYGLSIERCKEILAINKEGNKVSELIDSKLLLASLIEEEVGFEDGSGEIELPPEKRKSRKKRRKRPQGQGQGGRSGNRQPQNKEKAGGDKPKGDKPQGEKDPRSNSRRRGGRNRGGRNTTSKDAQGNNNPKKEGTSNAPKKQGQRPKSNAPRKEGQERSNTNAPRKEGQQRKPRPPRQDSKSRGPKPNPDGKPSGEKGTPGNPPQKSRGRGRGRGGRNRRSGNQGDKPGGDKPGGDKKPD